MAMHCRVPSANTPKCDLRHELGADKELASGEEP